MPGVGASRRPAFARCVAIEPATFAATYWGRAPLLSRAAEFGDRAGFTDLLDQAGADELLSRRGLRTPFLRVAKNGAMLPEAVFTGGAGAGAEIGDQVLDEQVLGLYADGATLVLQGLHRMWPPLVDFAGELATTLRQPVAVNAYLTPAANQGFATHYDTHDVFVLQVQGRKRWRLHEPVLPDPLECQPWSGRAGEVRAQAQDRRPVLDTVLVPGDALYLPRGWLHSATAEQDSSLHLTVGIRALTRYALVEALLALAAADPRLRAPLPLRLDVGDPDEIEPELSETVEALRDWLTTAQSEQVAADLRRRGWPTARPAPLRPLAQAARIRVLGTDDVIRIRAGLRWRLAARPDNRVAVQVFDRTVSFPGHCAPALRAVLAGPGIRVGDLPGLHDDADRLVLARRLLREAIVVGANG
ncbi:cupin domain-containing protein [Solwaraspora sp. WMMB335]|uniref:cupin domain-containing protein n=1 Tax=Solwaraspora sp. WMMB335 TaxID=3404118 RepID=UPI003B948315